MLKPFTCVHQVQLFVPEALRYHKNKEESTERYNITYKTLSKVVQKYADKHGILPDQVGIEITYLPATSTWSNHHHDYLER